MALLNQFIDFDVIIDSLWDKFEPLVNTQLDKLREQVVALLPVIAAAAGRAIADEVLNKDPDIPGVSDIFDLSETIRGAINGDVRLPFQIPGVDILGGLFKGFGR